MIHVIKRIDKKGKVATVAMYCNDFDARYNLQSFIMGKKFNAEPYFWNQKLREKADAFITSSSHFFYYEDEEYLYSIRKY